MKAKLNMLSTITRFAVAITTATVLSQAHGKTIYQYIDRNGATAFSDTKPSHTDNYIEIDMPDAPDPDPTELEQSIDDMIAVSEKLEAKRKEAEAAIKLQQEQQNQARQPLYPQPNTSQPEGQRGSYIYPGYYWQQPYRNRAVPPYRFRNPENPHDRRLEELRQPIRIPGFNTDGNLQQRLKPYDPAPRPGDGR